MGKIVKITLLVVGIWLLAGCTSLVVADDLVQIEAGTSSMCVITDAGAVECAGRFGTPISAPLVDYGTSLSAVSGLESGVVDLAMGDNHGCVVIDDGGVKCWGRGNFGALGNGGSGDTVVPLDVVGLPAGEFAVGVAASGFSSCALLEGGSVYCWGRNSAGMLGVGDENDRNKATPVVGFAGPGASTAEAVEIGAASMCVSTVDTVFCTGADDLGQQGNGPGDQGSTTLTLVDNFGPISEMTLNARGVCVLNGGLELWCWGENTGGFLGLPGSSVESPAIVEVLVDTVAVPGHFGTKLCGILDGLYVSCIGTRYLGDGSSNGSTSPVIVSGSTTWGSEAITAGPEHICALTTAGEGRCWGNNFRGQLSDGTTELRLEPVVVMRASS